MLLTVHAYFRGVGIPDGPETEVFLELGLELLVLEMSDVNNMQNINLRVITLANNSTSTFQ